MKWISNGIQSSVARWAFKRDIPQHLRHFAKRCEFRFEIGWIVRDENLGVLMISGGMAPTFDFYLKTPGHVIGLQDLSTADNYDWAMEWRNAMADRRLEQMQKIFEISA